MTMISSRYALAFLCALLPIAACGDDSGGAIVDMSDGDAGTGDSADTTDDGDTTDGDATDDGEQPAPDGAIWTDPTTGLMWQIPEAPDPRTGLDWYEAVAYCEALELAGYADWTLPTIDDLRSLVRGCDETATGGACPTTHACPDESTECYHGEDCMGCMDGQGPGLNGCYWPTEMGSHCQLYWSSSMTTSPPDYPCYLHLRNGHLSHNPVEVDIGTYAICVRTP